MKLAPWICFSLISFSSEFPQWEKQPQMTLDIALPGWILWSLLKTSYGIVNNHLNLRLPFTWCIWIPRMCRILTTCPSQVQDPSCSQISQSSQGNFKAIILFAPSNNLGENANRNEESKFIEEKMGDFCGMWVVENLINLGFLTESCALWSLLSLFQVRI